MHKGLVVCLQRYLVHGYFVTQQLKHYNISYPT